MNEAFVAELGVALGDFAVDAFDFLGEADAFSGHINFNLEHQLEVAHNGHRSDRAFVGLVDRGDVFDTRQTTEEGNVGTDSLNGLFVAFDEERHANGRSKLHFSSEIANGVDHLLDEHGLGSGFFVELSRFKLRVRGDHDARFFVFAAHAGRHRHLLPKFFGDERNDRVSQTQNAFEHRG